MGFPNHRLGNAKKKELQERKCRQETELIEGDRYQRKPATLSLPSVSVISTPFLSMKLVKEVIVANEQFN